MENVDLISQDEAVGLMARKAVEGRADVYLLGPCGREQGRVGVKLASLRPKRAVGQDFRVEVQVETFWFIPQT